MSKGKQEQTGPVSMSWNPQRWNEILMVSQPQSSSINDKLVFRGKRYLCQGINHRYELRIRGTERGDPAGVEGAVVLLLPGSTR